jgi:hypothetical protein
MVQVLARVAVKCQSVDRTVFRAESVVDDLYAISLAEWLATVMTNRANTYLLGIGLTHITFRTFPHYDAP